MNGDAKAMKRLRCGMLALVLGAPLQAVAGSYLCVTLDYPPLIQKGSDGQAEGLAVEVVTRVFHQLGHTVKIEIYPWGRALAMARNGLADCVFTIYQSPEREEFLDFSRESIIPQIVYLYTRKDSSVQFNGDLHALKGLRVGTAYKVNYGPKFEQARAWLDIQEAPDIEVNFRKLAMGRVDVVPSNLYTATSTLALPSLHPYAGRVSKLPTPIENVASHIAFSKAKNLTVLRDAVDVELKRTIASGIYPTLLRKYGIEQTPELERFLQSRR